MDATLQIIILVFGLLGSICSIYKTRNFINPVTILFVCFFLPMFFSLFRLSGLQARHWHYDTYVAMYASIGAWLIFPTILILAKPRPVERADGLLFREILKSKYFLYISRIFGLTVLSTYIASNYIQAGNILVFQNPEVAFQIHASFPFGLRFFARAVVAGVVLLYAAYWVGRNKIDLALLLLVFLIPLSRLSRIDVAMAMVALAIMFAALPLFRLSFKKVLILIGVFSLLLVAVTELGSLRQNRFGEYFFKFSSLIEWQPETVGPSEIIPFTYGYFSLAFENFDHFVRQFKGEYGIAMNSFDWLFRGLLKLNWFTSYAFAQVEGIRYMPVSSAATVPTALLPFYSDLGPIGMAIPMMIYMTIFVYLYYRSKQSMRSLFLYTIYSAAFSLTSFQAIIIAPFLVNQMVEIFIIFLVVAWMEKNRVARHTLRSTQEAKVMIT